MPVTITLSEKPALPSAEFYGGFRLHTCTSAFSVKEKSWPYRKGILTAGHCPNGQDPFQIGRIRFVAERFKFESDAQWHRVVNPHTVDNVFRANTYDFKKTSKYIIRRKNMIGRYVCHYGISSGHSCGRVTSVFYKPGNYYAYKAQKYVKVEGSNLRQCSGDSGGPWFKGNRAYGINSGGNYVETCQPVNGEYAIFTGIGAALWFLNLNIL
jgi:hypothetical protein